MFQRGPVVITTLEEDFKKIGLLQPTVKTESTDDVDTTDAAAEDTEAGEGELDEARRIRRRTVAGGRKMATTKRTSSSKRIKSKRNYRKSKMKIKLKRKKKMRNSKFRRRAKFLAKRAAMRREGVEANSEISKLMEDISSIVGTVAESNTEFLKGFANIALISDILSETFAEWSERLDESFSDQETYDALAETAESLADLAEAAAEVATALKEGREIEPDDELTLESLFKEYMSDLLAAMDLYNEAKMASKDEEDDEDEDEDEEDDEDEDDKEEAVRGDKESSAKKGSGR